MRDLVIFDLDGTLALIDHRRHLVEGGVCTSCFGSLVCPKAASLPAPVDVPCPKCRGTGRLKPDWPAFFRACVDDEPNLPVIAALHAHRAAGHHVMIVSGRSDEVRAETEAWLFEHVFTRPGEYVTFAPIMRNAGDYTPDDVLKRQWLDDGTIPRDRVLCAYDDRDKVVAMWRAAGVPCFQVAPGDF